MAEASQGLVARMTGWFRRGNRAANAEGDATGTSELMPVDHGSSIFRPFAKRDQALSNLQESVGTFTGLMTTIKDNLGDQNRRQDELLGYLSHLPKAIEGIPETNRLQVESLKAISSRLDQQNEQQHLIAEVLGKLADNDVQQRKTVEDVRDRMEAVAEQNKNISDNLSTVGSAMQTVSHTSQASAQVLVQMRDNIERRDGQLEQILHKQASKFTAMLTVAIVLAIAALIAVGVIGYQVLNRPGTPPAAVGR